MAIGRRKFFAGAKPPSNHQCFTSCIASAALLMFAILVVSVTAINDLHDSREQSVKFDPGRFVTEDAIILEVPDKLLRQKRELDKSETISGTVSNVNNNERVQKQLETLLLPTGPCITSKGLLGQCTPFRQCYPYFKLPDLNNWETWILGMYDTCSYFTAQGRQMYGVCCTNTIAPLKPSTPPPVVAAVSETTSTKKPAMEEISNGSMKPVPNGPYQLAEWPPTHPPLPTHPPDHTIPPLPTHPPSPGFPVQTEPTVSTMMTVKPSPGTTWPTTKPWPTPQWPPVTQPLPTHPPSPGFPTAPTHPTQPAYPTPPSHPTVDPGVPITDASCGAKNGYQDQERIVGGVNAELGEWPWIAALFNGGRQFCGGSLIDSLHILSAAHCVAHMSSWDVARLTVRLGDYNIKTNSEVNHVEKRVKRVVRHRGFDARTLYNDVAIITLDSPVTFNNQIRSICLPSGSGNYAGKTATVIGWGSLRESGPQPGILQKVNIPIWTNAECRQKYGPAAPGGIVEHMLCAGQASRDSCSGDSGGPLMINEGRWTQVGIVSWGIGCGKGQYPGVYTRVTHFLPWINKNRK